MSISPEISTVIQQAYKSVKGEKHPYKVSHRTKLRVIATIQEAGGHKNVFGDRVDKINSPSKLELKKKAQRVISATSEH